VLVCVTLQSLPLSFPPPRTSSSPHVRAQLGSEKGDILIWSVEKNCLLYDIKAHVGRVYDCSWSGEQGTPPP
jgi:hypothetical protein